MSVLIEGISVIVRKDSIELKYPGNWESFVADIPNSTLCSDELIARVGFLSLNDTEDFVNHLEARGLQFLEEGNPVDIAVADQQKGLTTDCDWLEIGRVKFGDKGKVMACWFFDAPRIAAGKHFSSLSFQLATPVGWEFKGSLSQQFHFAQTGKDSIH
jgi:hypothetical protein